jgi:hypothetical protein
MISHRYHLPHFGNTGFGRARMSLQSPCLAGSKRIPQPRRRTDRRRGAQLKSKLAARRFCKLRDRYEERVHPDRPESTLPVIPGGNDRRI